MPYSIEVFCAREQYEPSTRWYLPVDAALTEGAAIAKDIAGALANVVVTDAVFTRFEILNADGKKVKDGAITGKAGLTGSVVVDPKLFLLVRKNAETEVQKPSVVYTPFPSDVMVEDGILTTAGAVAFGLMVAALSVLPLWNSDGFPIVDYTFRHLTRRKKVRRLV